MDGLSIAFWYHYWDFVKSKVVGLFREFMEQIILFFGKKFKWHVLGLIP